MSPQPLTGKYPFNRPRRTRASGWSRDLHGETRLSEKDLIWPLFVREGSGISEAIPSMPGVRRHSLDKLLKEAEKACSLGIPAIALFPQVESDLKDDEGSEGYNEGNLVCRSVRQLKKEFPDLGVICDVALDPYTSHGQDGILIDDYVHNDQTVEALVRQAAVQVDAGCDILAPSDMMDGRIGQIRSMLENLGHHNTQIMAYSAKYASAFYGPFRDAVGSGGNLKGGNKKTYQMDPANSLEALREVAMDIEEGADSVIVKPGMPCLDIIRMISSEFSHPVFAYQVSGEYAMLMAAADKGWLDRDAVMMESLLAFKRAGATGIWTYFAPAAAKILKDTL
ncbi:porphobilinogen synthase [Emcibacter sp.]|uniref:porphobilinogen synthase n=1 Tax=Emcibacter sp. TaxID=1979954 RepID=UPI003A933F1E